MENSICFGLFDGKNRQLAFARVVTDYVVFAWLMDFFVVEDFRGQGSGKKLLQYIVEMPELQHINGIGLRTNDAH
ncbi:MAG: GNAT family N-acetyltransferase [Flavobacteriaceae bacterium]